MFERSDHYRTDRSHHYRLELHPANVEDTTHQASVALRTDTLASSGPFTILPFEIIQHIASCLPISAATAFALCNHHLSQAVGSQYWTRLHHPCEAKERELFLQLLDRDLPYHLFCHRCALLHLPSRAGIYEWENQEAIDRMWLRRCYKEDYKDRAHDYYPFAFRFENVRMATKLYHLGLDFGEYLGRLTRVESRGCEPTNLTIFEPRIVSDEMFTHTQYWLWLPTTGQLVELPREIRCSSRVCAHLRSNNDYEYHDNPLTKLLQCKIEHINKYENPCEQCTGLKQCWYCPTEVQIDVKVFKGRGTALIMTK